MRLSLLIPTLIERQVGFQRLADKLSRMISDEALTDQVEVLAFPDSGERTLGTKRNELIRRSRGDFTAFVDDDDDVSEDYVRRIDRALHDHPDVDCVGICGLVYFRGAHPRRFVHSVQYDHYFSRHGVYYRPPYILNPIRREIAQRFLFESTSSGEDIDWAMRMSRAGALEREFMIDSPLYLYYSRRRWEIQRLIDLTEPVRRPLGLELANRHRLTRWIRRHLRGKL